MAGGLRFLKCKYPKEGDSLFLDELLSSTRFCLLKELSFFVFSSVVVANKTKNSNPRCKTEKKKITIHNLKINHLIILRLILKMNNMLYVVLMRLICLLYYYHYHPHHYCHHQMFMESLL